MDTKELDLWMDGCIRHYNKITNNKMKTVEERIVQLENAHGRLYNQTKEMFELVTTLRDKINSELESLNTKIREIKQEPTCVLPDKLIEDKKYQAIIKDIISHEPTDYYKKKMINWEVKLVGKEHVFHAFVKPDIVLEPGMMVEFTYKTYLQLYHLKVVR